GDFTFATTITEAPAAATGAAGDAQATAVSTNGGPAVAEAFGRRQIDINSILASLEAQAEGALATGGSGDFTFATTIVENQPAATDAAGDDTTDDGADDAAAPTATQATTTTKKGGKKSKGAKKA
ncbi:hypothetical protein C8R45DRAFT_1213473, partial [Mycena sanguinolenta]